MNKLFLTAAVLAAVGSSPAAARLQLSIGVGASVFSCFDGQLSCDVSGGANNLLVIDQTIGGAFVQLALAQSTFGGHPDELQLSSSNIQNTTGSPITIKILASDTGFTPPTIAIRNSASLTFNDAVGSGLSTLKFWADPANVQGANPSNTPGTLLETVSGTPTTNPDSFSGSNFVPFPATAPFSMTEGASLALIGGGSITGFNQSMQSTAIPEPRTWALMALGFGLMAALASWKRRETRFAL